jgi:hypothetical protein
MERKINMEGRRFQYFAFISYKSDDLKEAWNLKKKLDSYKLPTVLCKQYEKERKPTYEAFLDKTNIQPGDLTDELRQNLDSSHYLIVVCSPRSAKSDYVKAEIEWFTRDGRENEVFLFIIESDPARIEDSFNPAIKAAEKRRSERDGEKHEILGVNIKEKDVDKMFFIYRWPIVGSWLQRERAYMQLTSKLLNLEFEQLWSYQKIRLAEKIIAWIVEIMLVLSAISYTWYINQTVDITACLNEKSIYNENLPPLENAIVTLVYDDKTEVDTIRSIDSDVAFTKIHRRYLNKEVRFKVKCQNYLDVDTTMPLTKDIVLNIHRDSLVFGNINFKLWNPDTEKPVANVEVEIARQKVTSDDGGIISLFVPLEKQRKAYHVKATLPLANDTVYLPCGPDDVVLTK